MAYDRVIDSEKFNAALAHTADAIRAKTGNTALIPWNENTGFANAVNSIGGEDGGADDGALAKVMLADMIENDTEFEVVEENANVIGQYAFYGKKISLCDVRASKIKANAFSSASSLKVLILRYDGVAELANTNAITSSGLYDMDGDAEYGGKMYVPEKYISQYTSATNWSSVLNGSIELLPIEGSEYE